MNIFSLDRNPKVCAMWLDDVRSRKMILESVQLLSTACNILQPNHNLNIYKSTHVNRSCSIWVRESVSNYMWLLSYVEFLGERNPLHESLQLVSELKRFVKRVKRFPKYKQTPFKNSASNKSLNICYKHIPCVHKAYKLYLSERWDRDVIKVSWDTGLKPSWYKGK